MVLSHFSLDYLIVVIMRILYYDVVKQIWYFSQMHGIFVFWLVILVFFLIGVYVCMYYVCMYVCLFVCLFVCYCLCIAADCD